MKKQLIALSIFLLLAVSSCAPVLKQDTMDAGLREFSLSDMGETPGTYEGKLFVLGGIIVGTRATQDGSLIEAVYVPVDSRGYLKNIATPQNRFLALFPRESGFLDPVIFRQNREITFAGEFQGLRQGNIDEMEYTYPFFIIKELYLWAEKSEYYYWQYYYAPYSYWWGYPYMWYGYPYSEW